MLLIPFLHPYPQTTLVTQADHNHRLHPWHGLRILALCLAIMLGLGWIQPALAALVWQVQIVDSVGQVGFFPSVTVDSNNHPVISYYDNTNKDLKLAHCGDATCSSGNTIQTVDSIGNVGQYTSMALDSSGNPVISYHDVDNGDLKLAHCGDATCSSGNMIVTVDSAGSVGQHTSLVLDSNGYPVISYQDGGNGDLKLVHCGDATCSSGNTFSILDQTGNIGWYTSLKLDSSGNPVISYYDNTNVDLKLAYCGDATCSSSNTIQTVDSSGFVGHYSSLALDSNGYPVISYWDEALGLMLVHCGDATCSSGNIFSLVHNTGDTWYISLVLDSNGKPVISYLLFGANSINVAQCGDVNCSSGNIVQPVASAGVNGGFTSLALDSSGKPIISYYDDTNRDLAIVQLISDDSTPPVITPTVVGTLGNNGWYTSDVTVSWNVADAESTVSAQSGCDTTVLTSDTASITLTCTATSEGGTINQSVSLKLDKTLPTLTPVVSPNPVMLGGTATVTAGATDALSGVASESCGALDTSSVGIKTVTCTATDNAGNSTSATINYTVAYPWTGFFQPVDNLPTVNTVNAGQAIPVKFSLGGNYGLTIFASGYPKVQTFACGSGGSSGSTPIEETVTAGNSSLQYNAKTQTYSYIWKTDKAWAGTCRQLIVRLIDGTDHSALFQFNGKVRSADAEGEAEVVQQVFLPLVNR